MSQAVQKESRACFALWVLCVGALAGCGGQSDARAEARELMTSLNAVSDEGSLSQRSVALARLDKLELHAPQHVQARKVCREAHQGLLDAEAAQAEARRALASASVDAQKGSLAQTQADAIASGIERSNRALATAKQRFPECERLMRSLLEEAH